MNVPSVMLSPVALACMALAVYCGSAQAQTNPDATELPSVGVTAQSPDAKEKLPAVAPGGKVAKGVRLGVLGNTAVMDAPFSVTAYTAEALADREARTVADVLIADPSVQYSTSAGHQIENFLIRGFDVLSTELGFNGMYGLLPSTHMPTEGLERVELIKGPTALLGGMSPSGGVGGLINLVPKRAGNKPITELTTSYSSGAYGQVHLDVGRRFGEDNRLGVRVNGVYGQGETGVDDQKKGRRLLTLGMDYIGRGWKASLDAYSSTETIRNGSPAMYGLSSVGVIKAPSSSSNLFKGTWGDAQTDGALARVDWQANDDLSLYASAGTAESNATGLLNGTRVVVNNASGASTGYIYNLSNKIRTQSVEVGGRLNLRLGGIRHELTASASRMDYDYWNANTASTGWAQNIYNPVTPVMPSSPATTPQTRADVYSGVVLADTMHLLSDSLLVTVGARQQKVEQYNPNTKAAYDGSALSPALGVVYKPWGPDVSLYANRVQGLSPGATVGVGYTNTGDSLNPYRTVQSEMGVKWRQGTLTQTVALFQIDKPSAIDVTNSDGTKTLAADGKQRHRGLEWSAQGQLTPTWGVMAGYAYTQAEYVKGSSASITGKDVYGVPTHAASLGADWATPLAGLSLNGRLVYTGQQWLNSANTLRLPSWTRIDVGAKYATQVAGRPVVFRGYIENLANKDYWAGVFSDGYATLSSPRTVRLSATFSF